MILPIAEHIMTTIGKNIFGDITLIISALGKFKIKRLFIDNWKSPKVIEDPSDCSKESAATLFKVPLTKSFRFFLPDKNSKFAYNNSKK